MRNPWWPHLRNTASSTFSMLGPPHLQDCFSSSQELSGVPLLYSNLWRAGCLQPSDSSV